MSDPVQGTAQVVSCSANRGRGVYQNCHPQLVVSADGLPATAVEQATARERPGEGASGETSLAEIARATG